RAQGRDGARLRRAAAAPGPVDGGGGTMSDEPTGAGAGARERVLVATIGNRDPLHKGQPTGPLRAAAAVRPARAYLVHSERTADRDYAAAAAETARLVQQAVPGCRAEPRAHGVANPTDLPALVGAMAR